MAVHTVDLPDGVAYGAGRRSGIVVKYQPVGDVVGKVVVVCSQNSPVVLYGVCRNRVVVGVGS